MQERILLSTDPKDPNFRLRVALPYEDGILQITEEELTSRSPDAQVTEARAALLFTSEQALWLRDALVDLYGPGGDGLCDACAAEEGR